MRSYEGELPDCVKVSLMKNISFGFHGTCLRRTYHHQTQEGTRSHRQVLEQCEFMLGLVHGGKYLGLCVQSP